MKKKELEKIIQGLQDKNLCLTGQLEAERIKNSTLKEDLEKMKENWMQAAKDYEGIRAKYESLVKDTMRKKPNKFAVHIPVGRHTIGKEIDLYFLIARAVRRIEDYDIKLSIIVKYLMDSTTKEIYSIDKEVEIKPGNYVSFSVVDGAYPLDMVTLEITTDLTMVGRSASGMTGYYTIEGEIICTKKTGEKVYETD